MWNSAVTFDNPTSLLVLPVGLLIIWLIYRRSRASINDVSRRQVAIWRSIIILLLTFALAGITWHRLSHRLTTIYVVDYSDSVPKNERQSTLAFIKRSLNKERFGDRVGLVVFGREPFVEFPPEASLAIDQVSADVPGDATDIQAALEAAAGAMPLDSEKRIVLCTDGLENLGNASSTIGALRGQGVQVDIAPTMLVTSQYPEALVDRVVTPAHASVKSPIQIRVVLSSTVSQNAKLTISRDGTPFARGTINLHEGKSAYYFDDRVTTPGEHVYSADLEPAYDTHPENNLASSAMLVNGAPHVLYLRDANEPIQSSVTDALTAQGLSVDEETPSSAPTTLTGLANYDSIVLSNVAANDLAPSQLTEIEQANQNFGVGLGMIGGVNSFGAGGYIGTPIEDALPVKMTPKDKERIPSADVVIVLDASGSMSAEEDGVEKVEIAAKAALQLLDDLTPEDRVAVLAVTETPTIVMPLVSPADSSKYVSQIEAVEAGGGGIDCRNGLEAAYTLLQTSNASIKHVIICPDTTDSEQKEGCIPLATAVYKVSRITTSVCGIGELTDVDVPFQKALAAAGHGQLFVANQASNLPRFFQRDVQNIQQKLILEGSFRVNKAPSDPVVDVAEKFPKILGYNIVDLKPGAVSALSLSSNDDPLFAYWRHGTGKSFAFTSDDDAHWSRYWLGAPMYASFWARIVRWSLKGNQDESFQTLVTNVKGQAHIVVDAFTQDGYATGAHFSANIAGPDNSVTTVPLTETAPGRYDASFNSSNVGNYLVQVQNTDSGGDQTSSITTSYSPEYADLRPNTQLLGDLAAGTGGIFLNNPDDVFRRERPLVLSSQSLVEPFLLLACLFFVIDVAWRRFGWRLGKKVAYQVAERLRTGAVVVAGSIKKPVKRSVVQMDVEPRAKSRSVPVDPNFLKTRTAVRAELSDEDDPFPFVASLPRRARQETGEDHTKEK